MIYVDNTSSLMLQYIIKIVIGVESIAKNLGVENCNSKQIISIS